MSGVLFVSRCHPADSEVISSTPVIHRFLTKNPKVMGTHFFSPANVMQLLENVRTSNLAVCFFGIKQQKLGGGYPIIYRVLYTIQTVVGGCLGFLPSTGYVTKVVATQWFFIFTPKIGEDSHFD